MKPDDVASEMLEKKLEVLNGLAADSEDYGAYNWEEGETDPENTSYFDMFEKMIADVRSSLDESYFDGSYEDVEINISSLDVHVPQLTEYEWARICESTPL